MADPARGCENVAEATATPSIAKEEDLDDEEMTAGSPESTESTEQPVSKGRLGEILASRLKKTNSLKRTITLPRNPFSSSSSSSTGASASKVASQLAKKAKSSEDSANGNSRRNVRNLLQRVVSQLPLTAAAAAATAAARSRPSKSEVSEERLREWRRRLEEGKVPGVVGISNHGNTCFINAVLQCLSYTDIIAEYFVLDQYKSDLRRKRRRPYNVAATFNKRAGGKGEVTEQLATLLKSLWSLQYDPEISIRFKSLVDKHASQYKGSSQHDAQEFLLWLLDQVHEDLNTATKRKYKPYKTHSGERTDEQLASESLANHMRCNNSFVMEVFQAQFRSSLTCPTCQRQSNTFDPFLCVSLPIPQKQLMPVYVTVLYIDQSPRQVKLGLTVGVHETVEELRVILAKDTGIAESQLLLTEIGPLGFGRTLRNHEAVSTLKDSKEPLYCIELPVHRQASEDDGAYVVLTWVNVLKEGPIEKRFGSPYTIQVSRETLYTDLQKLLLKEMACILHDDILISAQKVPLFKIRVLDGFDEPTYLESCVDLPLYVESVEQAINLCTVEAGGGSPHVKLILEWDMPAKSQVVDDDSDVVEEHASVKEVQRSPEEATSVTLQECFKLYTSAEKLGQGDAWFCPACNRKQEVVKRMGLWSVPEVLVIHLKRFRQSSSTANKLSTLVEFPLEGFDMSPNVAKSPGSPTAGTTEASAGSQPSSSDHSNPLNKMFNPLSVWKHPKRFLNARNDDDYVYDLYAVCNHHGTNLQSGHYTAFCRNPTDGQWYSFDDVHTKVLREQEVVAQDAYILFYQRQSLCASSSSSSSSGSSGQEHWVFRMPDFTYKKKSGMVKTSNNSNSNFQRNSNKYATLPAVRTSNNAVEVAAAAAAEPGHQSDIEAAADEGEEDSVKEDEDEISRPIDQNDVD